MGKTIGVRLFSVGWSSLVFFTPLAQAAISCGAVNTPVISNIPDSMNIQTADISISGNTITAKINLKQLPASVQLNAPANAINVMEYAWGVDIDVDNNAATGDSSGFDYEMMTSHFKFTNTPSTAAFGNGFQTNVWALSSTGGKVVDSATMTSSATDNSLTLTGNVPGVSTNARFRLKAVDRSSSYSGMAFFTLPCLAGQAATTSRPDCLFSWAEKAAPQFFSPAAGASQTLGPYYYRQYSGNVYLFTTTADSNFHYIVNGSMGDAGPLSQWYATAQCN